VKKLREPARVYFMGARATRKLNLLERFRTFLESIGLEDVVSELDEVGLKLHFGAPGHTRYLRPDFIREIVEKVKKLRGKPFLCESAGLGYWKTSMHGSGRTQMLLAYDHGYVPETVGAPIAIVGGMMGTDTLTVPVPNGKFLKEAYLAKDLVETDTLLVLSHFKGHCRCGFAGALKQLGMGGLTKKGKWMAHYLKMPEVDPEICDGCEKCVEVCPYGAITMVEGKAVIDPSKCECCFACVSVCPKQKVNEEEKQAIVRVRPEDTDFQVRVVDQLAGLLEARGRRKEYYFNFLIEIPPNCDCERFSDVPIVQDIGILASEDPVAIDQASIDLVNAAPGLPDSRLEDIGAVKPGVDKWRVLWPNSEGGLPMLRAAESIGIGTRKYELKKIKFRE